MRQTAACTSHQEAGYSAEGYSDAKVANRNGNFGWEFAHEAISLDRIVARTSMYTCAAKVWGLSLVQGPFLSPRAKPWRYDSQLVDRCVRRGVQACPMLISRFKEREETVKIDVFSVFVDLLRHTGELAG